MIYLDDNNYLMATYEMHEAQEESLYQHSLLFPDELNLKINLTYREALSELDKLSSIPEYKKYFHSIVQLTPSKACPKVLGAWFDKVEGFIRVALLDEEIKSLDEDSDYPSSKKVTGKIINFSIKNPSQGWTKIADFYYCISNRHGLNLYLYCFFFNANNLQILLNIFYPLVRRLLPDPIDLIPENAVISSVTEFLGEEDNCPGNHYHIINKGDLNKIYDIERLDNRIDRENSHRCFYIPYEHIIKAVNIESDLGQLKHRLIKSATSSVH